MNKAGRFITATLAGGAGIYVAASWVAGRLLARHLISAEGLVPATAEREALLAALDADARLWHWCGGIGQCTTCAVIPISGAENLTPPTKTEKFSLGIWFAKPLAFIRSRWKGKPIRLACQSYVRGPVEVAGLFGKRAKEARDKAGI